MHFYTCISQLELSKGQPWSKDLLSILLIRFLPFVFKTGPQVFGLAESESIVRVRGVAFLEAAIAAEGA